MGGSRGELTRSSPEHKVTNDKKKKYYINIARGTTDPGIASIT